MRGILRLAIRIAVVVATMAAVLVPAMVTPARTISVPITVSRTVSSLQRTGRISTAFRPTHLIFSWRGDEDTGLQYRTVGPRGQRSEWMDAPEDEDAAHGDNHYSGALEVDRPIAVHWRRVVPRGARMGIVRVDYLNTMDGPRRKVRIPAVAQAQARTPNIITRAQWGADESLKRTGGSCRRRFYRVQQFFVHHTAGTNFDSNPAATMRAIYHFHTRRRGWCDLGYNFVISHDGRIFEGRWARHYRPWEVHSGENIHGRAVAGAHVARFNSGSVGIALMGNFQNVTPSPASRRALAQLLAWGADRHRIPPRGTHTFRSPASGATRRLRRIAGHRDAGHTACPGRRLYDRLPSIRRDTAQIIGNRRKALSRISLTVRPQTFVHGRQTVLSGTLARRNGNPLGNRNVTIYMRPNGRAWRKGPVVSTAADGTFSVSLRPGRITRYVAVFEGGPRVWGSQTTVTRAFVRHRVTIRAEGGIPTAGGTTHYMPDSEVEIAGEIAPRHGNARARVAVLRQRPDGTFNRIRFVWVNTDTSGNYRYTFEPPATGTYRANARYPRDEFHLRGFAGPVTFTVGEVP
jgi:hypothetical protein